MFVILNIGKKRRFSVFEKNLLCGWKVYHNLRVKPKSKNTRWFGNSKKYRFVNSMVLDNDFLTLYF